MNDLMTKSFQSYVELKKQALKEIEADAGPDLEAGYLSKAEEKNLSIFYAEAESIQSEMSIISDLLTDLQHLYEQSKTTHTTRLLRGLQDRMDSDVTSILCKANTIKTKIEALDRSNVANRLLSPSFGIHSPVDRSRVSVANGLRTRLREMMNEFQELRERIVAEHREGLKRRYFSATGEVVTEEVLDKLMSGGEQMQVFDGKPDVRMEVLERNKAVSDIKRSLERLQQVFLDMAVVMEMQGESLDDIEENVVRGKDYIAGGTDRLASAQAMRKTSKWWCVLWVVVAIVLLICVILIFNKS